MSDLEREVVVNRRLEHDRPGRSFLSVDGSRWGEWILPAAEETGLRTEAGLRVVAVTSFFDSREILGALVDYERAHPKELHLVAAATDDAINAEAKIGLKKRIWRHYSQAERVALEIETIEAALQAGVPVYTGELKIDWFRKQLAAWRPDVIIVCGCGQIFDQPILRAPRHGVYNFHPSDLAAGHGAGAQPYEDSLDRADPMTCWTVHRMTAEVDAGPIVGSSSGIRVADARGELPQDAKPYYAKLKGAVGPMLTILLEDLVRMHARGESVEQVDFEARLPESVKAQLAEPIT